MVRPGTQVPSPTDRRLDDCSVPWQPARPLARLFPANAYTHMHAHMHTHTYTHTHTATLTSLCEPPTVLPRVHFPPSEHIPGAVLPTHMRVPARSLPPPCGYEPQPERDGREARGREKMDKKSLAHKQNSGFPFGRRKECTRWLRTLPPAQDRALIGLTSLLPALSRGTMERLGNIYALFSFSPSPDVALESCISKRTSPPGPPLCPLQFDVHSFRRSGPATWFAGS
ncbi:hypothetical protein BDY21DRAFT_144962 [Lineolata rhizophorae]|uniref:Uncharacterized protein n=1 Tax=Lineolata rhizophorae TaxID=578093 RepID=A0A6A6NNR3_9PEZI|nr:hypothetical protein BDY21DRAFT_144962 [Lineolata rhizophorae]